MHLHREALLGVEKLGQQWEAIAKQLGRTPAKQTLSHHLYQVTEGKPRVRWIGRLTFESSLP
jgi:hypothetical protein